MSTRRMIVGVVLVLSVSTQGAWLTQSMAHGNEEHGAATNEAAPQPPGHGQPRGESVTLTGELVDLVCYMQHPEDGQGPQHSACARKCMKQGLPAGLLSEGKLYLLLGPGHDNISPTFAEHAGKQVSVKGNRVLSGGMQGLVVAHLGLAGEPSGPRPTPHGIH